MFLCLLGRGVDFRAVEAFRVGHFGSAAQGFGLLGTYVPFCCLSGAAVQTRFQSWLRVGFGGFGWWAGRFREEFQGGHGQGNNPDATEEV